MCTRVFMSIGSYVCMSMCVCLYIVLSITEQVHQMINDSILFFIRLYCFVIAGYHFFGYIHIVLAFTTS